MAEGPLVTRSAEETREVAARLGATLAPGAVVALRGELGAGKTTFVQGLAAGLGVPEKLRATSPTYVLLHLYEGGRLPLYHLDAYRLADAREAEGAGLGEILEEVARGRGVCAVEWPDRIQALLPPGTVWVDLSHSSSNENLRTLRFRGAEAAAGEGQKQ